MDVKNLLNGMIISFLLISSLEGVAHDWDRDSWSRCDDYYDQDCSEPRCLQNLYFLSADFLYETTDYHFPFLYLTGISEVGTEGIPLISITTEARARMISPEPRWTPGVRLGVGWRLDRDSIGFRGFWTGYRNQSKKENLKIDPFNDGSFEDGKVAYHLNYNIADLELDKVFYPGWKVEIRPYFGVRGAFLHQNNHLELPGFIDVFGIGVISIPNFLTTGQPYEAELRFHSWGLGPRMGIETSFDLRGGFSLIGNISGSLLYGKHSSRNKIQSSVEISIDDLTVEVNELELLLNESYFRLVPNVEIQIGFSWSRPYRNGGGLELHVFYESKNWWETSNQFFFERALSVQGLRAGFCVEY